MAEAFEDEKIVAARCKGAKPDGARCRSATLEGEQFCHSHHPAKARSRASKKAASTVASRKVPAEIRRVRAIQGALLSLWQRSQAGTGEPARVYADLGLLHAQLRAMEIEQWLQRLHPAQHARYMRRSAEDRMDDLEHGLNGSEVSENVRRKVFSICTFSVFLLYRKAGFRYRFLPHIAPAGRCANRPVSKPLILARSKHGKSTLRKDFSLALPRSYVQTAPYLNPGFVYGQNTVCVRCKKTFR